MKKIQPTQPASSFWYHFGFFQKIIDTRKTVRKGEAETGLNEVIYIQTIPSEYLCNLTLSRFKLMHFYLHLRL